MKAKHYTLFVTLLCCTITITATTKKQAIAYARTTLALTSYDDITIININS